MGSLSKSVTLLLVALFLASLVILPPVNSQSQLPQITISGDGSVVGTDKIHQNGNTYTLTANLNASIAIEKDNITLDGAGFKLQGLVNVTTSAQRIGFNLNPYSEPWNETAVTLKNGFNNTIKNLKITGFGTGITLYNSTNCTICDNELFGNNGSPGAMYLESSSNNWIKKNDIKTTVQVGVNLEHFSNGNLISENRLVNNSGSGFAIYGRNNIVANNSIDEVMGSFGIIFGSSNNLIIWNNITSSTGISFNGAVSSSITKNSFFNCGVAIEYGACSNNIIFENTIVGNDTFYVVLFSGVSENNTFYRNNIYNFRQVMYEFNGVIPSTNIHSTDEWDNGQQGNYWGDYLTKYSAAKELGRTGTYETPYAVTPSSYPYVSYDNHPLTNPVEISQTPNTTPSWTTPTPTNQAVPTPYIVIIATVAILSILLVSLLLYRRQRNAQKILVPK